MMGTVIMSGIVPQLEKPSGGILAGGLAVGSTVKLMENGVATEYLVVNKGIPSGSSLYDASCDGLWLLRKDIHSNRQWNTSYVNTYESSAINTWLNGEFFNTLGSVEQATIKQVKIPYCVGNGASTVNSGANGLSVKAFLLGGYELGLTTSDDSYLPEDGAKLDYFEAGRGTSAGNKRIAYLNGSATNWWIRSPRQDYSRGVGTVPTSSYYSNLQYYEANDSYGVRPALVLPSNAVFDETTMLLKGVA